MAYIIGVDCGTSGTKTVLFDENGKVIASATAEYPMYQPKNGYAEQNPAHWAAAMLDTVRAVVSKSGVNKDEIKGIGISGQMHGLVILDENDNVIRPAKLMPATSEASKPSTSFLIPSTTASHQSSGFCSDHPG